MGTGASTVPANPRAVLICHSSQEQTLRHRLVRLLDGATADADLAVVTERYPRETHARAAVLASVGVAVLALDAAFQRAPRLVETVSYLKDTRRSVLAGPLAFHVRPAGAVGAICFALGTWEPALFCCANDDECARARERVRSAGLEFVTATEVERVVAEAAADAELANAAHSDAEIDSLMASLGDTNSSDDGRGSDARVLVIYAGTDGERVAAAFGALNYASTPGAVVEHCACDALPLAQSVGLLAHTRVAVFVITAASMQDARYRVLFDTAVRWRVSILPIHAAAGARMPGWLAMCMAGKLWYQVALDALEQIHTPYAQLPNCPCKVHDACLAADFLQCLSGLLLAPTEARARACEETLDRDLEAREAALTQLCREQAIVAGGLGQDTVEAMCTRVSDLVAVYSSNANESESDASGSAARTQAREQLEALGVAMNATAVAAQVFDDERAIRAVTPAGEDLLPAPVADSTTHLPLAMTHYQVTRTGVSAPVPRVLDAHGVPLRNLALDAMFSYQWGAQDRVLDIHQQGQVHHLRAWFDVYGHMQGNVNAAMATAVESVACVVVFLTRAYVQSVNCRLEFQYARACGKPMIFAFLDDPRALVLELPDWVTDAAGGSDKLSVHPSVISSDAAPPAPASCVLALDLTCDSLRGVAMTAVLLSAIRQLAAARHRSEPRVVYDSSLLLYASTRALRFAVTSAVTTALESTRASTSAVCTRCGAAFAPDVASTLDGCRKHAAYYMGGSILAGRWVCCQEPRTDGAGCELTQHTTNARVWTKDPDYGTHTWVPA